MSHCNCIISAVCFLVVFCSSPSSRFQRSPSRRSLRASTARRFLNVSHCNIIQLMRNSVRRMAWKAGVGGPADKRAAEQASDERDELFFPLQRQECSESVSRASVESLRSFFSFLFFSLNVCRRFCVFKPPGREQRNKSQREMSTTETKSAHDRNRERVFERRVRQGQRGEWKKWEIGE